MKIEHKKVRDGINSLILSNPLYAGVLLQQSFQASAEVKTFAVDGSRFVYNPEFADSLSFDEIKGVCAHEACHLAGCHHARMGSRDGQLWNEACDYVINPLLVKEGFKLPSGALNDSRFAGKSAEDVYAILYREKPPQNRSNGQGGNGNDPSPSCGEVLKPSGSQKQAIAKAESQVQQAQSIARIAGTLSADQARQIKKDMTPRYDWKEVLNRFVQEITARDYSWAKPNRRWVHTGLILPSLASRDIGRIVLAIDTSGSVSAAQVSAMVAEMRNCLDTYADNGISQPLTVIYCDSEINGVEVLEAGDEPTPKGGGGTAFKPVFDLLNGDLDGAACLVYLTDGYASDLPALASVAPSYPVLWGLIVDNDSFAAPFGEVCKVDIHA